MTGIFTIDTEDGLVRVLWFFAADGDECGHEDAASCVALRSDGRLILIDFDGEVIQ